MECYKCYICGEDKTQTERYSDLIYDCNDGEKTVTIIIEYCWNCGEIVNIYKETR